LVFTDWDCVVFCGGCVTNFAIMVQALNTCTINYLAMQTTS